MYIIYIYAYHTHHILFIDIKNIYYKIEKIINKTLDDII